jgi:hypothetical protein
VKIGLLLISYHLPLHLTLHRGGVSVAHLALHLRLHLSLHLSRVRHAGLHLSLVRGDSIPPATREARIHIFHL